MLPFEAEGGDVCAGQAPSVAAAAAAVLVLCCTCLAAGCLHALLLPLAASLPIGSLPGPGGAAYAKPHFIFISSNRGFKSLIRRGADLWVPTGCAGGRLGTSSRRSRAGSRSALSPGNFDLLLGVRREWWPSSAHGVGRTLPA